MTITEKTAPLEAARKFIETYYPKADGALLAGSAVRGEATETSDLDIVVFDRNAAASYRKSLIDFDWPIEVFVHNLTSVQAFFQSDVERARPSMPRMVAEGIILKDTGVVEAFKQQAQEVLSNGPSEWQAATIHTKRYFLTDALDDFIGCNDRAEGIFIAASLAELTAEFELRTHKKWIGASKWIVRSLTHYDQAFANRFVEAFDAYYRSGNKEAVIDLVDDVMKPHGGRYFEGFSIGKN